jgi:hypothetical protein
VPETWAAVSVATVPTNAPEEAVAIGGRASVVVGDFPAVAVVVEGAAPGAVVDVVGTGAVVVRVPAVGDST